MLDLGRLDAALQHYVDADSVVIAMTQGGNPEGVANMVMSSLQSAAGTVMDALDAEHVWAPPLIDMRFNYKPENPLYLLLVRAYRLPETTTVENTPAYAGCKSWVPLERPIETAGATPVIADDAYAARRQRLRDALESTAP